MPSLTADANARHAPTDRSRARQRVRQRAAPHRCENGRQLLADAHSRPLQGTHRAAPSPRAPCRWGYRAGRDTAGAVIRARHARLGFAAAERGPLLLCFAFAGRAARLGPEPRQGTPLHGLGDSRGPQGGPHKRHCAGGAGRRWQCNAMRPAWPVRAGRWRAFYDTGGNGRAQPARNDSSGTLRGTLASDSSGTPGALVLVGYSTGAGGRRACRTALCGAAPRRRQTARAGLRGTARTARRRVGPAEGKLN